MHKPFRIALCLLLSVFFAAHAQAQWVGKLDPITGDKLKNTFNGVTMDGIYKAPRERSGTDQFTETFNPDGSTDYREGPISTRGYWVVTEDIICFRYEGVLAGDISCFTVFKSGTCYYSYAPQAIGKNGQPYDPNLWSVKSIIRGDVSTCDNLVS